MKAFVTGHRGYIGAHLVDILKAGGSSVTGCDLDLFKGCNWEPLVDPDSELVKDVRSVSEEDLAGHDCVMHLAAISNDPMGELDEHLTGQINGEGSIALAECAKRAGVPKFLFASSCSMYGKGDSLDLDEDDPLNPVSAYAQSKIDAEEGIAALASDDFSPCFLRNATAYGDSPMLRIDLVANNLLSCAVARGDIRIMSDGTPWRPLIHCKDIARAFVALAEAPRPSIHDLAINIGGNDENYQVKDVADIVHHLVPEASLVFTGEVGHDPRNYRVRFDRLSQVLPDFRLAYTLEAGLEELHRKLRDHEFSEDDFNSDRFVRLRRLKGRMSALSAGLEVAK